jgi:hypothetical protein
MLTGAIRPQTSPIHPRARQERLRTSDYHSLLREYPVENPRTILLHCCFAGSSSGSPECFACLPVPERVAGKAGLMPDDGLTNDVRPKSAYRTPVEGRSVAEWVAWRSLLIPHPLSARAR